MALRVGPREYWCFTSDPVRDVPLRQAAIDEHDGDVWAAITELARVAERLRRSALTDELAASPAAAGPGSRSAALAKAGCLPSAASRRSLAFVYLDDRGVWRIDSRAIRRAPEFRRSTGRCTTPPPRTTSVNPYLLASIHMQESRFSGLS